MGLKWAGDGNNVYIMRVSFVNQDKNDETRVVRQEL